MNNNTGQANNGKSYLGVASLGLMAAAAVVTSLRGMPMVAKEEMTMFLYLGFAAIFYLIPAMLNPLSNRRLPRVAPACRVMKKRHFYQR